MTSSQVSSQEVVRTFHPGWYGAVMGTAIVGVAAALNPGGAAALQPVMGAVGVAFVGLAALLAVALGVPYVVRWFRYSQTALNDLRHPVLGALYATFPGGLLVLAAAIAAVGPLALSPRIVFPLVVVLGAVGAALAFVVSVAFTYVLFMSPEIRAEHVNGGWFIPPVINIIVPLVLVAWMPQVGPDAVKLLAMGSYATWGIGFFLFLLVASLLYGRLVYHPLPAAPLAPSLWIGLGPIGVGSLALLRVAQGSAALWGEQSRLVVSLSAAAALALWGFGWWWLAMAAVLLYRYRRRGGLPYGVGWWAFTFPLGAFTVSTLALSRFWQAPLLEGAGVLLFALLLAFWGVVALRSLEAVRSGAAWRR
ncbi:MAG: hypothetical protein NZM18_05515 [Thermoflexales bacterium]|nr:hypothetical protein [Thermoflexales bacterium]MDW8319620.1 hypothetical protein [Anaerolineae bacterium]